MAGQCEMTTIEKIQHIIADDFGRDDVSDSTTLEQLAIDSLELIDLTHALETQFGIEVPDDKLPTLDTTVVQIAELIEAIKAPAC